MTNEEILERVIQRVPYSNQITDLSLSEKAAIRFTWRGDRFRVTKTSVEQVSEGSLLGSNVAILLEELLRNG